VRISKKIEPAMPVEHWHPGGTGKLSGWRSIPTKFWHPSCLKVAGGSKYPLQPD